MAIDGRPHLLLNIFGPLFVRDTWWKVHLQLTVLSGPSHADSESRGALADFLGKLLVNQWPAHGAPKFLELHIDIFGLGLFPYNIASLDAGFDGFGKVIQLLNSWDLRWL